MPQHHRQLSIRFWETFSLLLHPPPQLARSCSPSSRWQSGLLVDPPVSQDDGGKNGSKSSKQQQQQKRQEESQEEICPVRAIKRILRAATEKELDQLAEKVSEQLGRGGTLCGGGR